ncbi:MAG: ECF transporter S component [Clostridia bacterium]|nr:ECF transporter S component [Clostridia bacterium]
MQEKRKMNTKTLAVCAMLVAIAYALVAASHFLLPPLLPAAAWLKYDPKDVILAIGGLLLGPVPALLVTIVTSVLEMLTFSGTGWIGLVMNVVASSAFILPGALLYKYRRNLNAAVIGLLSGAVLMTVLMLLWNAFLTPLYMGAPREAVIAMLVPVFLPFNAIKGGLNAAITLLLYKPLTRALRSAKLLPARESSSRNNATVVTLVTAAVIVAICVAVLLILRRG